MDRQRWNRNACSQPAQSFIDGYVENWSSSWRVLTGTQQVHLVAAGWNDVTVDQAKAALGQIPHVSVVDAAM